MMFSLKKGDRIGIVAPSSFLEDDVPLKAAIKHFQALGYEMVLGQNIMKRHRYMAGAPLFRADDLMAFYKDSSIKAIFTAAGGAGSTYVLDELDYKIINKNPKPIFGFSDTTALQNGIYAKVGNVNYTGMSLRFDFKSGKLDKLIDSSFKTIAAGIDLVAKSGKTVNKGVAEGKLVGGCLSVLCYLCGTKYFPDLKDKILLLEDVGEKTYRIDLLLQQIKMQPNFDKLKGIVFGNFTGSIVASPTDGDVDEVIKCFCQGLRIPIIKDFMYGHEKSRYILPIGGVVKLDANKCMITVKKD